MTEAGLSAHPDRDALARTIQRPAGSADLISRARRCRRSCGLTQLADLGKAEGDRDPRLRATRTGRKEIQRAIRRYRSGGSIDSIEHLAWLAVLLADIRVRDDAWARMDPAHRDDALPAVDRRAPRRSTGVRARAGVAAGIHRVAVRQRRARGDGGRPGAGRGSWLLDGPAPGWRGGCRASAVGGADADESGCGRGELRSGASPSAGPSASPGPSRSGAGGRTPPTPRPRQSRRSTARRRARPRSQTRPGSRGRASWPRSGQRQEPAQRGAAVTRRRGRLVRRRAGDRAGRVGL